MLMDTARSTQAVDAGVLIDLITDRVGLYLQRRDHTGTATTVSCCDVTGQVLVYLRTPMDRATLLPRAHRVAYTELNIDPHVVINR